MSLDIRVDANCKTIRIDPAFAPCLVTILSATWNGEVLADNVSDVSVHPVNGQWVSDDTIIFNSEDPNIEFGLTSDRLSIQERNHLCVKLITTLMSPNAAEALAQSVDVPVEEHKDAGILKKIGKKIMQAREARYYVDDEE